MKRRTFIYLGMTGLATAVLQACSSSSTSTDTANNMGNNQMLGGMGNGGMNMQRPTSPTGYITGEALSIPPLYEGSLNNGVREFALTASQQSKQFYDGQNTTTWSFSSPDQNVPYLGLTLKLIDGEQVRITYTNNLSDEITVHGHGMHVPGSEDGGPQRLIAANGGTWTAQYTVQQPACTAWYHPHPMGRTAEQVYHGLAGLIIVEESGQNLGLPNTYGEDDIPLVLQDRVFNDQYQLDYSPPNMQIVSGWIGDVYLANGQAQPVQEVPQGWIRLRLLNGSNASVYKLTLSNGADFRVIASDNGFLPAPAQAQELIMSPGERLEVLVDMTQAAQGDSVQLKTDLVMPAQGMDPTFMNMDHSGVF